MRGKKINVDFVSDYIYQCAIKNKNSIEDVCAEATQEINAIDAQLRAVEELKKKRSYLQDVLIHFNKISNDKSKDKNILSFYNIPDLKWAFEFCNEFQKTTEPLTIINTSGNECIKQMISVDVLMRENDRQLNPGRKFKDFMEFYKRTYKK